LHAHTPTFQLVYRLTGLLIFVRSLQEEEAASGDQLEVMRRVMGFSGFDTTKGKAVADNATGASGGGAARHKKMIYRQYMNRRGGFNRPLQKLN
jgi:U4/U6.U5 tri-snRNP-associated protein 3